MNILTILITSDQFSGNIERKRTFVIDV